MSRRRVSYFYDPDIGSYSYGLAHPMKPFRMRLTHNLVTAYGMHNHMDVLKPHRAVPFQMTRFHTDEYIDFLHRVTPETAQDMTGGGTRFLTGEDNPAFDGLFEFCSISAGGSLAAAERLNSGMADIAINWAGGLHHAKKGEASGFCYCNDIVLAILELLRYHTRVLYIDIDCHHGDGVEEAFYTTDRVLTCSFHKQKDYFPGTGKVEDRGIGKGKGYALNVPFLNGVTDGDYKSVFEPVIQHILDWYRPEAVVLQCGADSLSGDKLGCFNLSMNGHADCVRFLRQANVPLILLGGGGYTVRNVSSVWTYETACAIGNEKDIDPNLPYNEYFEWYGPRYRLEVQPSNMQNDNYHRGYLDTLRQTVLEQLRDLPFAPSAASQPIPRKSVAQDIGLAHSDSEDELDAQIRRQVRDSLRNREPPQSDDEDEEDDASSSSDEPPFFYPPSSARLSKTPANYQNIYYDPYRYPESDDEINVSDNEDEAGNGRGDRLPLPLPHAPHRRHGENARVSSSHNILSVNGSATSGTRSTSKSHRTAPNSFSSASAKQPAHSHHTRTNAGASPLLDPLGNLSASPAPMPAHRRHFFSNGASAPLPSFASASPFMKRATPIVGRDGKPRIWDGSPMMDMDMNVLEDRRNGNEVVRGFEGGLGLEGLGLPSSIMDVDEEFESSDIRMQSPTV